MIHPNNLNLINNIETSQAQYFSLNAKHHIHQVEGGQPPNAFQVRKQSLLGDQALMDSKPMSDDDDFPNYKTGKQMVSFDISSELKDYSPRN